MTSKQLLVASALFLAGAAVGSLAPFIFMLGGNGFLFKLVVQTWWMYLFAHGWWPWCLGGALAFSLVYLSTVVIGTARSSKPNE